MTRANEPAFPTVRTKSHYSTDINVHSVGGMTLREYYAGLAMQGLLACPDPPDSDILAGRAAVVMADALLAALAETEVKP